MVFPAPTSEKSGALGKLEHHLPLFFAWIPRVVVQGVVLGFQIPPLCHDFLGCRFGVRNGCGNPKVAISPRMKLVDLPTVKLEYRCLVLDGFCRILSLFLPNSPRPPWIMLASFIHPCTCHLIISLPSLQPKRHRA